jgi:hypothetical protein
MGWFCVEQIELVQLPDGWWPFWTEADGSN